MCQSRHSVHPVAKSDQAPCTCRGRLPKWGARFSVWEDPTARGLRSAPDSLSRTAQRGEWRNPTPADAFDPHPGLRTQVKVRPFPRSKPILPDLRVISSPALQPDRPRGWIGCPQNLSHRPGHPSRGGIRRFASSRLPQPFVAISKFIPGQTGYTPRHPSLARLPSHALILSSAPSFPPMASPTTSARAR